MILEKEFYFIRHGQTDYNVGGTKVDHDDVSLNATGIQQAIAIESVISTLPVKSICCSPLKRAEETKEIISSGLQASHYEIPELGECTLRIWNDMAALGSDARSCSHEHVQEFMGRVLRGLNLALAREGPVLIVAHGGVHWSLCCLLGIADHEWSIENCQPVHFFLGDAGRWQARLLKS